MVCVHLKQLYDLCLTHQLKLGGADLVHVVCKQCNMHDVCPSNIRDDDEVQPDPPKHVWSDLHAETNRDA